VTSSPELVSLLENVRGEVDRELARRLGEPSGGPSPDPGRLREAMRYAVLGGGKRLRPAVVLFSAQAVGGDARAALPAACALELLHAYTLVHDDLPAMDDDRERRGRPTVHVAFGEAQAILVGDALLTEAFGSLADLGVHAASATRVLCARAGVHELLMGQALDLSGEGQAPPTLDALERLDAAKTGALFSAAAELGAIAAGAPLELRGRLSRYGLALGIAFQHADDLADGDHPSLAALARQRAHALCQEAQAELEPLGEAARPLSLLCDHVAASAASAPFVL
jgi:geranylgeranyl pyrophosphate synthase